jgi:hypothetical protein
MSQLQHVKRRLLLRRLNEDWGLGIELGGKPATPFFDHGGAAIYDSYMSMFQVGQVRHKTVSPVSLLRWLD